MNDTPPRGNPNCPACKGAGVVEIQSSGDRETGFDREWDDCYCEDDDGTAESQEGQYAAWEIIDQGRVGG